MLNRKAAIIFLATCMVYLLLGCSNSSTITIERSIEKHSIANELKKIARSAGVDQRKCIITDLIITAPAGNINAFQLSFMELQDTQSFDGYLVLDGIKGLTISQTGKVRTNPNKFNLNMHDFIIALGELCLSDLCEGANIEDIYFRLEPANARQPLVNTDKQIIAKIVDGKIIKTKLDKRLVVTRPSSKLVVMDGHFLRVFLIGDNATEAPL